MSDHATMSEHFIRHGDHLLDEIIVSDPVYLSEPFIRTQDWNLNLNGQPNAWGPCGPAQIADEIPNQKRGYVPHHLPGTNETLKDFPAKRGVPAEAALGGAETMYPEYMLKLRGRPYQAPAKAVPPTPVPRPGKEGEIEVLPVQGNVYMLVGMAVATSRSRWAPTASCWSTLHSLSSATRFCAESKAVRQADPLHHQHERASGSRRR